MRVADAVTPAPASFVWTMLAVLFVVYVAIAAVFVTVIRGLSARWRQEDDRELIRVPEEGAPYGPRLGLGTAYRGSPMRPSP
jgi:cytochrome d ubiquinol oxidase subunit I